MLCKGMFRLATALAACMAEDEAEAVITAGYKNGEPYERLYVGNINGGQAISRLSALC